MTVDKCRVLAEIGEIGEDGKTHRKKRDRTTTSTEISGGGDAVGRVVAVAGKMISGDGGADDCWRLRQDVVASGWSLRRRDALDLAVNSSVAVADCSGCRYGGSDNVTGGLMVATIDVSAGIVTSIVLENPSHVHLSMICTLFGILESPLSQNPLVNREHIPLITRDCHVTIAKHPTDQFGYFRDEVPSPLINPSYNNSPYYRRA
ncbi:metalloenzyme superfamily protein [Striga asiatica]|uniref:Metalloenzyme superfamily protein n=1 Tax=Striga asiatica TaxID=4170 RepID=A0A5A7Q8I8_STRAF|nr:metalloenzyme superfamily protein [Striga asiatica]